MLWGSRSFQTHCAFRDRFTCVPLRWCPSRYGPVRLDPSPAPATPTQGWEGGGGGRGALPVLGRKRGPLDPRTCPGWGCYRAGMGRAHGQRGGKSSREEEAQRGASPPPSITQPKPPNPPSITIAHAQSEPASEKGRGTESAQQAGRAGQGSLEPQGERGPPLSHPVTQAHSPTPTRSSLALNPSAPPTRQRGTLPSRDPGRINALSPRPEPRELEWGPKAHTRYPQTRQ